MFRLLLHSQLDTFAHSSDVVPPSDCEND
jgi:hypothetical protein